MRVLILPAQDVTLGSVTRCIAIAEEARCRGYDVGFASTADFDGWISLDLGCERFSVPCPPLIDNIYATDAQIVSVADYVTFTGVAEGDFLQRTATSEVDAITSFDADVVVSDFRLTASVSAAITKRPMVSVAQWPLSHLNPLNQVISHVDRLALANVNRWLSHWRQHGVRTIAELCYSRAQRVVSPSIRELEPFPDSERVTYVGSLIAQSVQRGDLGAIRWRSFPRRLYVYLSASDVDDAIFWNMLSEAFDGTDIGVLVAVGRRQVKALPFFSDNVEIVPHCPGSSALHEADVFLCHGGQNSIVSAILEATPIIAIPLESSERRYNAEMAKALGVCEIMERDMITARMIYESVSDVIERKHAIAKRQISIRDTMLMLGGAKAVVDVLEVSAEA